MRRRKTEVWDTKTDLSYVLILMTLGSNAINPENNKNAVLALQKKKEFKPLPTEMKPSYILPKVPELRPKHESIQTSAYRRAPKNKL